MRHMGIKRNDSWIDGSFVVITSEMIKSKAYRELTGSAIKALILAMRKVKEQGRTERFKVIFPFSYAEAKAHGLSGASFWRAVSQLHRVGFLDLYIKGGIDFSNGIKTPSAYKLSLRWKNYGTANFAARYPGQMDAING